MNRPGSCRDHSVKPGAAQTRCPPTGSLTRLRRLLSPPAGDDLAAAAATKPTAPTQLGPAVRTLTGHTGWVYGVAISPNGTRHHQPRPDGADLGCGQRATAAHPHWPHEHSGWGGHQPRRHLAGHHQPRRDGADLECGALARARTHQGFARLDTTRIRRISDVSAAATLPQFWRRSWSRFSSRTTVAIGLSDSARLRSREIRSWTGPSAYPAQFLPAESGGNWGTGSGSRPAIASRRAECSQ
jgi:hypothetical protein